VPVIAGKPIFKIINKKGDKKLKTARMLKILMSI